MIPACDQVGTPSGFDAFRHFASSTTSGSASWMRSRIRESSLPRQSVRLAIFASTSGERVIIVGSLFKNSAYMPASPGLDHLPSVAGWIPEAGVDAAVAFDRFLRELDAAAAQFVIGSAAIVDDEDQRRHRALGDHLADAFCRRF